MAEDPEKQVAHKRILCVCVYVCVKSLQLHLTLCDVMDCSPPGLQGFSRQEYWTGLPCPPPGDLPNPGIETASLKSPALAGGFFTTDATCEAHQRILTNHQECRTITSRASVRCLYPSPIRWPHPAFQLALEELCQWKSGSRQM